MMSISKVMRYQIVKPVDCGWDVLSKVLRDIQYDTRIILNKTIQLCWEYQGLSSEYKERNGSYPKINELLRYTNLQGYCYNALKSNYNKLYSGNLSQTVKRASDKWKTDLKEILRGEKSIPCFKRDCPIDIVSSAVDIYKEHDNYYMDIKLISSKYKKELSRESTSFTVLIKAGDNTQKKILDMVIEGTCKLLSSQILFYKNKWFFNLVYLFEKKSICLDPENIMGVYIGVSHPVYIAMNSSSNSYSIQGEELEAFRRKVESRKKIFARQGKYSGKGRQGHGVLTKIQPIDKISHQIENFRNTCNHKYSRYIVEMALKNGCGTIQMEELNGINRDNKFLKNWSYYDLQEKIKYKAAENGITIKFINPHCISLRCSNCGHINKGDRPVHFTFKCMECGFETNVDYNAAKNVAAKDIDKIMKKSLKGLQ